MRDDGAVRVEVLDGPVGDGVQVRLAVLPAPPPAAVRGHRGHREVGRVEAAAAGGLKVRIALLPAPPPVDRPRVRLQTNVGKMWVKFEIYPDTDMDTGCFWCSRTRVGLL